MRQEAQKYNAVSLMEALDEFAKHNGLALDRFKKVGELKAVRIV